MVPNVAKTGSSFRGAFAYYLHDKRQEGEAVRDTSERVSWTDTRNLATANPVVAREIMIATAKAQEQLKAEAGIKSTGRKSAAHVYAYSLAWHPDEAKGLTKAEMIRAADESLRAIGAQDHQAVLVSHNDEPHPHVHVILNRVHPETGVMLKNSNDFLRLSQWALAYERERGKIWCQQREANQQARAQGAFVRASSPTPRTMEKDYAQARALNDNQARETRDTFKQQAGRLLERGQQLREKQKSQWARLSKSHQERKDEIYGRSAEAIENAKTRVKAIHRPAWSELGKRHTSEQRNFHERERRLFGKIENALAAIRYRRVSETGAADRGFMAAAFNFLTNSGARETAMRAAHSHERNQLAARQRADLNKAIEQIKAERARLLNQNRERFSRDREDLIKRQDDDRAGIKREWGTLSEQRRQAFEAIRRENLSKKADQEPGERREWSAGPSQGGGGKATSTEGREAEEKEKSQEPEKRSRGRSRTRKRSVGEE